MSTPGLLYTSRDEDRLHAEPTGGDRCGKACVRDRHLLDKGSYIHTGKARAAELFRNLESLIALLDRFIICLLYTSLPVHFQSIPGKQGRSLSHSLAEFMGKGSVIDAV